MPLSIIKTYKDPLITFESFTIKVPLHLAHGFGPHKPPKNKQFIIFLKFQFLICSISLNIEIENSRYNTINREKFQDP